MTDKAARKHMTNMPTFTGSSSYVVPGSASTADSIHPDRFTVTYSGSKKADEFGKLEKAVYAHIRAIRTLGRTSVNTAEIAAALSIPVIDVDRAVANLRDKGVKLAA